MLKLFEEFTEVLATISLHSVILENKLNIDTSSLVEQIRSYGYTIDVIDTLIEKEKLSHKQTSLPRVYSEEKICTDMIDSSELSNNEIYYTRIEYLIAKKEQIKTLKFQTAGTLVELPLYYFIFEDKIHTLLQKELSTNEKEEFGIKIVKAMANSLACFILKHLDKIQDSFFLELSTQNTILVKTNRTSKLDCIDFSFKLFDDFHFMLDYKISNSMNRHCRDWDNYSTFNLITKNIFNKFLGCSHVSLLRLQQLKDISLYDWSKENFLSDMSKFIQEKIGIDYYISLQQKYLNQMMFMIILCNKGLGGKKMPRPIMARIIFDALKYSQTLALQETIPYQVQIPLKWFQKNEGIDLRLPTNEEKIIKEAAKNCTIF